MFHFRVLDPEPGFGDQVHDVLCRQAAQEFQTFHLAGRMTDAARAELCW